MVFEIGDKKTGEENLFIEGCDGKRVWRKEMPCARGEREAKE